MTDPMDDTCERLARYLNPEAWADYDSSFASSGVTRPAILYIRRSLKRASEILSVVSGPNTPPVICDSCGTVAPHAHKATCLYKPRDVAALRQTLPIHGEMREALERIDQFVTKLRQPWGSWKTVWWEGEVSDEAAFSADNALMHVANIARNALQGDGL